MSASPILRPLGFGEVLDSAFTLFRRNFASFLAVALIPTAAMVALGLASGMHRMAADPTSIRVGPFLLFILVSILGTLVMWGALAHLASQAYGGTAARAAEGLRVGLRSFLPLLGTVLLAGLVLLVVFFAAAIVMGIGVAIVGLAGDGAGMAVLTGIMMLGMLVLYAGAASVLFAIVPAVVVEGKGPAGAIARSFELARGALPRLVGLMLVTLFIVYLPILGTVVLTGTFSTLYDPAAAAAASGSNAFLLQQVLSWSASAVTTPFLTSVIVVQYYDRRVRTEALDVQALTERLAIA